MTSFYVVSPSPHYVYLLRKLLMADHGLGYRSRGAPVAWANFVARSLFDSVPFVGPYSFHFLQRSSSCNPWDIALDSKVRSSDLRLPLPSTRTSALLKTLGSLWYFGSRPHIILSLLCTSYSLDKQFILSSSHPSCPGLKGQHSKATYVNGTLVDGGFSV